MRLLKLRYTLKLYLLGCLSWVKNIVQTAPCFFWDERRRCNVSKTSNKPEKSGTFLGKSTLKVWIKILFKNIIKPFISIEVLPHFLYKVKTVFFKINSYQIKLFRELINNLGFNIWFQIWCLSSNVIKNKNDIIQHNKSWSCQV